MTNIFTSLAQYIKSSSNVTYGDLINNTSKEEIIKRTLNEEELSYYNIIKNNDKQRILESCGNNKNNDTKFESGIKKYISGIGHTEQIM